jgi:FkbM family methyltransferase
MGKADFMLRRMARACYRLGDELLKFARHGDVWIDVGAHLGELTFPVARRNPSLRVYAFEPNLKLAAQRMGVLKNFVVLPMAIAEEDGCATFHINACDASSSLFPLEPGGMSAWIGGEALREELRILVPTIRLDTFLNRAGISRVAYLKVDAQGADLAVVRSAGERLSDIDRITLEVAVAPRQLYLGAPQKEEVMHYMSQQNFLLVSSKTQTHGQEENLTFARAFQSETRRESQLVLGEEPR